MTHKEAIFRKVEELKTEMLNWATDLVSFPTLSGQEAEAQQYVGEQLKLLPEFCTHYAPMIDRAQ